MINSHFICRLLILLIVVFSPIITNGQSAWNWQELPNMPVQISNNAVSHGLSNDTTYVYTFAGIDTTKLYSGINLTSMRYNTISGEWSLIPDLPDSLGKIAAAASTVNNIIYIIGGYHVFSNSSELSSNLVHRYDPQENTYLSNGAQIPIPIDDHVQAVWKDSLVFVVTGWSNNGNVNNVQIYNPFTDSWTAGTPTPNNNIYKAFGASGSIVGDTIYYNGGATGGSFNSTGRLRKGIINPDDPTQIEWTNPGDNPGSKGYRMASLAISDKVFWVGGSGVTYNFNGIAYNGSGVVNPLNRILQFNTTLGSWIEGSGAPYGVMDLRGIAQIDEFNFIICGGMTENQQVTDRVFQLTFDPLNSLPGFSENEITIYPNPAKDVVRITSEEYSQLSIYSMSGQIIHQLDFEKDKIVNIDSWIGGTYFFVFGNETKTAVVEVIKF